MRNVDDFQTYAFLGYTEGVESSFLLNDRLFSSLFMNDHQQLCKQHVCWLFTIQIYPNCHRIQWAYIIGLAVSHTGCISLLFVPVDVE